VGVQLEMLGGNNMPSRTYKMGNHQSLPGNPAVKYELTRVYNGKCQVETICADNKTAVSPSFLIEKTCFWAYFDRNVRPDPLPQPSNMTGRKFGNIRSPGNIIIFGIQNGTQ
jgi:hypothetical protein